ncbi:hypothetical protein IFM89_031294 [Coptis chinensis]|uniref:RNase H type-1 domain-containing protein n=1 Tax=Coptis chinensis TaxID=261450 RepID=A0A835MDY6_9MAGN|nr:hypothetical protein IFM89_031294 [Coptis chinensis]
MLTSKILMEFNTDGSVGQGQAGIGGAIRDELGEVVMAFTGVNSNTSVIYQELLAIKEGLNACILLQYSRVNVESDSMRAIQAIKLNTPMNSGKREGYT